MKKPKLWPTMLSKKCKYAIHALVYMARRPDEKFLIREISEACLIPRKFLENILLELKHAGMLGSRAGKGGGYYLRRKPSEINLAEIIRLFDGAIAALPCATYKFYEPCRECADEDTCSIRYTFLQVRNTTVDMLKRSTLEMLVDQEKTLSRKKSGKRRS
jgi:Rrf2 family protein